MGVDLAYLELLDSNLELQEKLVQEETCNNANRKKICTLEREINTCEQYISYLEKNLGEQEDEIERLKVDCQSTLCELQKCCDFLELKEALVVQDKCIIQLEDIVSKLKKHIHDFFISKRKMDVNAEILNPTEEILLHREAVSDCLAKIHLFFDRNEIPIPQNIDNIFDAATQNLDTIIWHTKALQNISVDQVNQIEELQILLDVALRGINL
ncbi:hypothetical protein C1646_777891 [Rhizophagus diaphanus]|nr:hypothetical protein C1646_777891 [Rhizophagus diaphanus] [Rhizophagus sp. MUCL 43196]